MPQRINLDMPLATASKDHATECNRRFLSGGRHINKIIKEEMEAQEREKRNQTKLGRYQELAKDVLSLRPTWGCKSHDAGSYQNARSANKVRISGLGTRTLLAGAIDSCCVRERVEC